MAQFVDSQLLPQMATFLRSVKLSPHARVKSEFVSEVFLTTLANVCISSAHLAQKVFESGFLALFVCNNIESLVCKEELTEPLLFLIQNVSKHFDEASANALPVNSEADLHQLSVFLHLVLDMLRKDDCDSFLSEDLLQHVMRILGHLLGVSSLKTYFEALHRDKDKLGLLAKKLIQCLYNKQLAGLSLHCLNKLASLTPVEEYQQFRPAKLVHAMTFVLKMASDSETRKDAYFLLSNLVLNYPCLKVFLPNQALLDRAGLDFTNSVDSVRLEIVLFLGNMCFGLEPEMVGDLLEHRVLEILQIGFDFENLEVISLVLQSYLCFFQKFVNFQEELSEDHLEQVMKFANEQDFIDKLDHFDQVFFQRAGPGTCAKAQKSIELVNTIYSLKSIIGLETSYH